MSNAFHQPPGDRGKNPAIYVAGERDLAETGRAIGISLLGVEPVSPATFQPEPEADLRERWLEWLDKRFEGILSEPFIGIYLAAGEMRNRRIQELDGEIHTGLSEPERDCSQIAAVPFFEGTSEIRRLPQWTKFLGKIERGETPGHVTSLFALRAALFHLPLLPALVSYLYFEWKSGMGDKSLRAADFERSAPESLETARRVFHAHSGPDFLESI